MLKPHVLPRISAIVPACEGARPVPSLKGSIAPDTSKKFGGTVGPFEFDPLGWDTHELIKICWGYPADYHDSVRHCQPLGVPERYFAFRGLLSHN